MLDAWAEVKRHLLALPTSRDAPGKLAASYLFISMAPETTLHPEEFILFHLNAINIGSGFGWIARHGKKARCISEGAGLRRGKNTQVSRTAGVSGMMSSPALCVHPRNCSLQQASKVAAEVGSGEHSIAPRRRPGHGSATYPQSGGSPVL